MTSTISNPQTLTPGGDDPSIFDPKEAWYPVFYVEDLDRTKPNSFTLLGEDLVIWWEEKTQSWQVFEDKCPHRLVPLSEGRINEAGLLECPYHGWAFSGSGNCENIPQQPEGGKAETSARACVKSMPAKVSQGLLFVYPGTSDRAEKVAVPIVDAIEEDKQDWVVLNTFRDLPYDAATLLENVTDASHVPFTHHRTVSNRSTASSMDLKVIESNKEGYKGVWEEGPRKGTLGTQYTNFIAPALIYQDLTSKQFGRTLTVVYATPISKGKCRLFARFPFKFASKIPAFLIKLTPTWYSHLGNNKVLEDDQIFLHYQERYLAGKGGFENFSKAFYLPTKADAYIFELRNWFHNYQAYPFPGESLPPLLAKEQLLERYHSHTKKCSSCGKALAKIQNLRTFCGIIAAISWIVAPFIWFEFGASFGLALSSTIVTLILAIAWFGLGKFEERFYLGTEIPPRNLPDRK